MSQHDTIVAVSSSTLPAARAIIRLSGGEAFSLAQQLAPNISADPGFARTVLRFCDLRIPATVYRFRGPRSFNGEDIIEFHIPGNPLLTQMLLEEFLARGARAAEPGEFTSRAFFNGRIDLTQAEGVAAAISSQNQCELLAARRLLAGELTHRLEPIIESIAQTLALLEAGIDFSEEEISFLSPAEATSRIGRIDDVLRGLLSESVRFERVAREPTVVLGGRPNAGKSTLLNALAGRQRAVVSPLAGTTRDVLWTQVPLARGSVRMTDVAGLEEDTATSPQDDIDFENAVFLHLPEYQERGSDGDSSMDVLQQIKHQMQQRALRAIESADVLLLVVDACDDRPPLSLRRRFDVCVRTKADLPGARPADGAHLVSAHSGQGLPGLRAALDRAVFGGDSDSTAALALNSRHVRAIETSLEALARAAEHVSQRRGDELIGLELREALDLLGGIAGQVTADDVLTRIFSTFCIGK